MKTGLLAVCILLCLAGAVFAAGMLPGSPIPDKAAGPADRPADVFADSDGNGVDDALETPSASALRASGNRVPVIVWLKHPVTELDLENFRAAGGEVTHVYSNAIDGFSGFLPYTSVRPFASSESGRFNVIEESRQTHALLETSTRQMNVRAAVWNSSGNLGGFRGAKNASLAVIDTGMDDSHADLGTYVNVSASGWGAVTDATKIVGWDDEIAGDEHPTPWDLAGHGSHCSGTATGRGAASGNTSTSVTETVYDYLPGDDGYCYYWLFNVTSAPGLVTARMNVTDNNSAPGGNASIEIWDSGLSLVARNSTTGISGFATIVTYYYAAANGTYYVLACNDEGATYYDFTMSYAYPATAVGDGFNRFSGVAPDQKLVGVRVLDDTGSGWTEDVIAGLDWIVANRDTYRIRVVSMSLGKSSSDPAENAAVERIVENGMVIAVSAGNRYPSTGLGSPAQANKTITVAAIDDNDNVTYYSSEALPGQAKPDVAAPGGSVRTSLASWSNLGEILSVDSNEGDYVCDSSACYTPFKDETLDDYIVMQGTSMAAPHVAGLAALVIQAIEFNNNTAWGYTEAEALQVKNILLLTASETGRLREHVEDTGGDPTFDAGGRDVDEGFGRVNGDAAIEAVVQNLPVNISNGSDYLGGAAFEKRAWARRVYMNESVEYQFNLTSPDGADFDLYLYNVTGDENGSPILLSRSTNGVGEMDQINHTPSYTGVHYIAVKRFSGNGTFNLVTGGGGDSPLTVNKASQSTIDMWGGIAAWADKRSGQWDVYGYNLGNGTEFPISTAIRFQGDPAVYEDVVVWVDRRNGNWDIYGKNLTNGTEFGVFVLPGAQDTPDVYGDIAVAYGVRNGVYNILAYNASDASIFNVTSDANRQLFPAIYGPLVVFEDNTSGVMNIKGYNLSNGANFTVSPSANVQKRPDVYRDIVAWFENRSGSFDIFAYNLTNNTEIRITDDPSVDHRWPRMYGTTIVWHDNRSGVYGIYGYVLPSGPEFTVSTSATAQIYPVPGQFGYVWQGNPFGDNDMLARGR
ncbi:MAG: S8 family serine peptidase [Candidatus ainarchaeum sp.]|nr:S8 family serine peptidase [Candidatus ainarchaeum sp.]